MFMKYYWEVVMQAAQTMDKIMAVDESGNEFSDVASVRSDIVSHDDEDDAIVFEETSSNRSPQLTEENLEPSRYRFQLESMDRLPYKYWRLNVEAVAANKLRDNNSCSKLITEAASLVTKNPNRITNNEHKAVVIYNYLRFTNDSSYKGIASKKVLNEYMPEVLSIAERAQNKDVVNKAFKIMMEGIDGGFLGADVVKISSDEATKRDKISGQVKVAPDSSLDVKMSGLSIDETTKKDKIEVLSSSDEPVKAKAYSLDHDTSEEDITAPRESEFSTHHNVDHHVAKIVVSLVGEGGADHSELA